VKRIFLETSQPRGLDTIVAFRASGKDCACSRCVDVAGFAHCPSSLVSKYMRFTLATGGDVCEALRPEVIDTVVARVSVGE